MAEPPGVFAVMTLRVGGHLALPLRAEWDQPFPDRWLRDQSLRMAAAGGGRADPGSPGAGQRCCYQAKRAMVSHLVESSIVDPVMSRLMVPSRSVRRTGT